MPTIKYRVDGVEKVKQISSYYEAVVESNKLRKKGIPVTFKDNTKSLVDVSPTKVKKSIKESQIREIKGLLEKTKNLSVDNRYYAKRPHGQRERGNW